MLLRSPSAAGPSSGDPNLQFLGLLVVVVVVVVDAASEHILAIINTQFHRSLHERVRTFPVISTRISPTRPKPRPAPGMIVSDSAW